MMYENGIVVAVEGQWAWVETRQNTACGSCAAKAGCGQGVLNGLFSGKRHYIKVDTSRLNETVRLHDEVELAIAEHVMLKGSLWVYLLPLVLMIAGAVSAQSVWPAVGDTVAIAGAATGFVLAMLLVRVHAELQRNNPAYQPVLSRVVCHGGGETTVQFQP